MESGRSSFVKSCKNAWYNSFNQLHLSLGSPLPELVLEGSDECVHLHILERDELAIEGEPELFCPVPKFEQEVVPGDAQHHRHIINLDAPGDPQELFELLDPGGIREATSFWRETRLSRVLDQEPDE